MLTVYGADFSPNANKVRFVANAIGLPYNYKTVDLAKGEQRTAEFLKVNPVGRVPCIDDNGFTLFESNAIIKYLADTNNSPLYSRDPKKRAIIDQWIDFGSIHVGLAIGRLYFNRVIAKFINAPVDEQSVKDGLSFLAKFLPILDKQLKDNPYLAGKDLTLADIVLLSALDPAEVSSYDLSPYPNVVRWRTGLKKQSFYTKVHNSLEETLAAASGAKA